MNGDDRLTKIRQLKCGLLVCILCFLFGFSILDVDKFSTRGILQGGISMQEYPTGEGEETSAPSHG